MAEATEQIFELSDGRRLVGLVAAGGDDALVWCHGTPFPSVPYEHLAREAELRGLRLVSWARPGYAGSSPQPGRRVVDFAADASEVLEQLGIARAIAVGWSGGGPHALSLGCDPNGPVGAVVTVGGVAPSDDPGLPWTEGMGPENVEEFEMARRGGAELEAYLRGSGEELREVTADAFVDSMAGLIPAIDEDALAELGLAEMMASSLRRGVEAGIEGWAEDDEAFLAPWGFSLAALSVPVSLWQGSEDLMVPMAHGRWLAEQIDGVTDHLLEGEGHLSLITRHLGAMLDEAIQHRGSR